VFAGHDLLCRYGHLVQIASTSPSVPFSFGSLHETRVNPQTAQVSAELPKQGAPVPADLEQNLSGTFLSIYMLLPICSVILKYSAMGLILSFSVTISNSFLCGPKDYTQQFY
jgi:hypothetical protein